MKTVRMADVIRKAGVPRLHLAWTTPARDPELRRAIKQHRLVSLHQHARGSRKDFGEVGFVPEPGVQYLIFPHSVRSFSGRRIIAIRYEELGQAVSLGPPPAKPKRAARPPRTRPPKAGARHPDNVVPFPRGGGDTPKARPSRSPAPASREPERPVDPVAQEIRAALDELREGHAPRARARLERLLRRREASGQ